MTGPSFPLVIKPGSPIRATDAVLIRSPFRMRGGRQQAVEVPTTPAERECIVALPAFFRFGVAPQQLDEKGVQGQFADG